MGHGSQEKIPRVLPGEVGHSHLKPTTLALMHREPLCYLLLSLSFQGNELLLAWSVRLSVLEASEGSKLTGAQTIQTAFVLVEATGPEDAIGPFFQNVIRMEG